MTTGKSDYAPHIVAGLTIAGIAALFMAFAILLRGPAEQSPLTMATWVGWASMLATYMLCQVFGYLALFAYFTHRRNDDKALMAMILSVSGSLLTLLSVGQFLLMSPSVDASVVRGYAGAFSPAHLQGLGRPLSYSTPSH